MSPDRQGFHGAIVVLFAMLIVGCYTGRCRSADEDRLLGSLAGVVQESVQLSPDGRRIVCIVAGDERRDKQVVLDGEPVDGTFDEIAAGTPIFSPDSSRLAFACRRGEAVMVVVDGVAYEAGAAGPEGWPVAELRFGPFGEAAVWKQREAGKTRLMVNGRSLDAFDDTVGVKGRKSWGPLGIVFEPSGRFFGFRASRDGGMVAGVARSRPHGNPNAATFELSPVLATVGARSPIPTPGRGPQAFAYIASQPATPQQPSPPEYVAFFETRNANPVSGLYEEIGRGSLVWALGDPTGVWFAARKGKQWLVVIRGKEGPLYDDVGPILPLPDGRAFHLARKGSSISPVLVAVDSASREELPGGEGVEHAAVPHSLRGERLAYVVTQGRASRMVSVVPGPVTGKASATIDESKPFDGIDPQSTVFSPDGRRLAFIAFKRGEDNAAEVWQQAVVVDGVVERWYDEVGKPVFSPSGERLAYRARKNGKEAVIVDGKADKVFDELTFDSPLFVPHTEAVVFAAREAATWRVYVDGRAGPKFERPVSRIEAPDDGTGRVVHAARFLDVGGPVEAVVIDGRRVAEFDEIFTTGDRRIACDGDVTVFGRRGSNLARVVIGLPGVSLENLPLAAYRPGLAIHRRRSTRPGPLHLDGRSSSGIQAPGAFDLPWDLQEIRERFPGRELRFHARVGIDGTTETIPIRQGSVIAEVHVDGERIASSPVLTWGRSYVFDLPLPSTGKLLRLVTTDGGDGGQGDLTNWCDAVVVPMGRVSEGGR